MSDQSNLIKEKVRQIALIEKMPTNFRIHHPVTFFSTRMFLPEMDRTMLAFRAVGLTRNLFALSGEDQKQIFLNIDLVSIINT